jgi:hypothetical protein
MDSMEVRRGPAAEAPKAANAVEAGRDAAIAAALDELVQAASARSEDTIAGGSGTRVARTGQHRRKGDRR